ncbi:hypothetical protein SDC9_63388 [bioreactor metagenome]|uniref:Uncharacterized protein n=1 Tax=bioreactor metagenome TaxID=1076179 RepID=A0A644XLD0_9ZZZZ
MSTFAFFSKYDLGIFTEPKIHIIMENKPYIFGVATSGDNFTDREKALVQNLLSAPTLWETFQYHLS